MFGCINFALFLNKRTKWTFPFLLCWFSFICSLFRLCDVCVCFFYEWVSVFIVYNIHMCGYSIAIFSICLINISSICRLVVAWCSVEALWLWRIWWWIMSLTFVCYLFVLTKKKSKNITIMFTPCIYVCCFMFTYKSLIFFVSGFTKFVYFRLLSLREMFTSALYPFFQSAVYRTICVLPSGNWTRYSPRVTSPSLLAWCDCWLDVW